MGLDPGVMPTRLYRWVPGFQGSILNRLFASYIGRFTMKDLFKTDYVAQTLSKMAIGPEFGQAEKSGKYYGVVGPKEMDSSVQSHDKALRKVLWDWTIKEVAQGDQGESLGKL